MQSYQPRLARTKMMWTPRLLRSLARGPRLPCRASSGSEAPTAREIEQHLGALSREVCPHALRRAIALPFLTARRRQVRGAYAAGRYDDALSHARVLRSEARAAYGAKHPVVASAIANEGLMHKALGDHDLAIDA